MFSSIFPVAENNTVRNRQTLLLALKLVLLPKFWVSSPRVRLHNTRLAGCCGDEPFSEGEKDFRVGIGRADQ